MQTVSHSNNRRAMPKFVPQQNRIAQTLQRQVANAFTLYLNYKHYHWQATSPLVRDLNIVFDELANEVYRAVEILSERIRAIGQNRVRIREFSKNATVKPATESGEMRRMLEEAADNVKTVVRETREAIQSSEKIDPNSASILKSLLKIHEKHESWLRYILEKRQGLQA